MTDLTPASAPLAPGHLAAVVRNAEWSHAPNTRRAYASALADFEEWLKRNGYGVNAGSVSAYLSDLDTAGAATSTIRSRLAAIASRWPEARRNPAVESQMKGIVRRRARGESTRSNASVSKAAFTLAEVKAVCTVEAHTALELRDRAMILVGFWGGFRRSELVALDWSDITTGQDGMIATVRVSKTDQEGKQHQKPIARHANAAICPVTALMRWRQLSTVSGAVFVGIVPSTDRLTSKRLTGQVVDLVVKRRARAAGLHGDYGAHSLRSGLVTTLRKRNVRDRHIKAITGHKTDKMLDHYDKSPLDDAMRAVADAIAVE